MNAKYLILGLLLSLSFTVQALDTLGAFLCRSTYWTIPVQWIQC